MAALKIKYLSIDTLIPYARNSRTHSDEQIAQIAARQIDLNPTEVWACSGSGALIRGLQLAWPGAAFNSVQVGAVPKVGKAKLWVAPEKYEQPAKRPPPFPSCDNYDAKVWQFASAYANDGALIWNVGR